MKIGTQIKQQREKHDLSQQDLADKLHISRQSISKWENGTSLPSFSNIIAISELFNVSLDELIKGDENLQLQLEGNHVGMNVLGVFIIGIPVFLFIFIILSAIGIDENIFEDILELVSLVGLIGLLTTINWAKLSQAFTRKNWFWSILFFGGLILCQMQSFAKGLIQGFVDGANTTLMK